MASIWGASYFSISVALRSFSPLAIVAARMGIASVVLWIVFAFRGEQLPRSLRVYAQLALLSCFNVTLPFLMITYSERYVSATITSILSSTTPLFVFVLASTFLPDEHLTWSRAVTSVITFGGVIFLFAQSSGHSVHNSLFAEIVIVASSLIFAIGNVYSRRTFSELAPLVPALLQSTFAFIGATVLALPFGQPLWTNVHTASVVAVIWLGVAASALTYALYFYFIRHWGSTRTSMNTYIQPIVGVFLGVVILGNHLGTHAWMASFVILVGILLFGWSTKRANRRYSELSQVREFDVDPGPVSSRPQKTSSKPRSTT
jgi:drug/metabolite transporter (DMT)-like permease